MMNEIEQALDKRVRPFLRSHGGEVSISGLEHGTLYIRLLGQCSECPSASLTVEYTIRKELLPIFPELRDVVMERAADPDLLEQARKMLGITT